MSHVMCQVSHVAFYSIFLSIKFFFPDKVVKLVDEHYTFPIALVAHQPAPADRSPEIKRGKPGLLGAFSGPCNSC